MSVLLYLLPLGLIFDLAGYLPPAGRLFLLYGLLALPLCLRPSKQAGWLGAGLLLAAIARATFPMPVVAETMLFLLVHLAIWSVMAPVPRALRAAVVAYAFLHLFLFVSPLGHPVVEAMSAAGNRISQWIAGQPVNLGPTYQNIGGFLLFLCLSIFSWDGSRVAALRTASFVLVALLLNALAAALMIDKVDFAADFAWTLKFRDLFGFPELWKRMHGMGVLVAPGLLFLAQLGAYLALHYDKAAKAGSAPAEPEWAALKEELKPGKRWIAMAAAAFVVMIAVVSPTAWRRPAASEIVFVERGVVSFTKPDYTRYGESAGGMFGMLPEYARMFGSKSVVVKDVPETLDPAKILVFTNLDEDLGEETKKRVWDFVSRGGRLWVLGDHTFIENGRNYLNELLAPTHISFNNDSAQFFPQGWFNSYRFYQGTPFSTLRDDTENRPGILVGASLELGTPAEPLVSGIFSYGDGGLDVPKGDQGHLGDFKYQPSERLGDLVLIAGERYGKGRVLVLGDTSSFFNNNLTRSCDLLRACLGWLGESNGWSPAGSAAGRGIAAALVLGLGGLAFLWRAAPVGAGALVAAGLVSSLSHGTGGLPQRDENFCRERLAVIDFSHQPNASKHSAMDTGLHGVAINYMRHGLLPVAANEWDRKLLGVARHVILNAPRQPVSSSERQDLVRLMERGGTVIVGCGFLDTPGSRGFLASFGCQVGDIPLGRFFDRPAFGQPVSFMSSWPIVKKPGNGTVLCASADWPLMVSVPVGKGKLVLIGDSEFLQNRNLEGHKNHDPANTAFIKNLLDSEAR